MAPWSWFFFFNDTATTEIYTLSLHDALPISGGGSHHEPQLVDRDRVGQHEFRSEGTRLNSSHDQISYAVFCLEKKSELFFRNLRRAIGPTVSQTQDIASQAAPTQFLW